MCSDDDDGFRWWCSIVRSGQLKQDAEGALQKLVQRYRRDVGIRSDSPCVVECLECTTNGGREPDTGGGE